MATRNQFFDLQRQNLSRCDWQQIPQSYSLYIREMSTACNAIPEIPVVRTCSPTSARARDRKGPGVRWLGAAIPVHSGWIRVKLYDC